MQHTVGSSKLIQLLARLDGKVPGGGREHIARWSWMLLSSRGAPWLLGMLGPDFCHEWGVLSAFLSAPACNARRIRQHMLQRLLL